MKAGQATQPIEIQEAATFRDGAAAAFGDLRNLLEERDPAGTQQLAGALAALDRQLADAAEQRNVVAAADIQAASDAIVASLQAAMPAAWQQHDSGADFDVLRTTLDQMEAAVAGGQYEAAESARLQAYAILESGPEARLQAFAPQLTQPIEDLFWYAPGRTPWPGCPAGAGTPHAQRWPPAARHSTRSSPKPNRP